MTQTQVVRAAVYFRFTFNSTPSTKCQIKYLPLRIVIYAREYTEQAGVEKSKEGLKNLVCDGFVSKNVHKKGRYFNVKNPLKYFAY